MPQPVIELVVPDLALLEAAIADPEALRRLEIAPGWRGRGLATAAVRELLREAFGVPEVRTVIAHTEAGPGPSVRVLEKAGFVREGEVPDDEVGTAWRYRLERERR